MITIRVVRESGTVTVLLLKHKGTDEWSFVNLTKGHICPCRFKRPDEAFDDLEKHRKDGRLLDWCVIDDLI